MDSSLDGGRSDWRSLVIEVEQRAEALSIALNDLRAALHNLAAAVPVTVEASAVGQARTEDAAEPENAVAEARTELSAPPPAEPEAGEEQALEESKERQARPAPGRGTSTPPAEWWTRPVETSSLGPLAPAGGQGSRTETEPEPEDEDAARAEVRRAVEEARAALAAGSLDIDESGEEPVVSEEQDEEAAREGVRKAVEEARAELAAGQPAAEPTPEKPAAAEELDEDAAREEVRRAVAEARAALAAGKLTAAEAGTAEETGDETAGNVTDEAEEASAEEPAAAQDDEDPEAAREAVRRAVEEAKAQLAAGQLVLDDDGESAVVPIPTAPRFQLPVSDEPMTPMAMVIEDPEGRVELARVYDALSRMECAPHAALLNYTAHSVTVGLNAGVAMPQADVVASAIEGAFGRPCQVAAEGVRLSVRIGERRKKGVA